MAEGPPVVKGGSWDWRDNWDWSRYGYGKVRWRPAVDTPSLADAPERSLMGVHFNRDVWEGIKCRFGCKEPPVGIFHVPEGCHCYTDPVQALCAQHAMKAESTGPIELLLGELPK